MIFGIGTDILQVCRVARGIESVGDTYLNRVYTKKEQEQSCSYSNREIYFASRFCAKEAVYKALRLNRPQMDWQQIEILSDDSGVPSVILHGDTEIYARKHGIHRIMLSISYETDYVLSFALSEYSDRSMGCS